MKIVFLDAVTLGKDMDFTPFEALGDVVKYPSTKPGEVSERIKDADVLVTNKVPVNAETLGDNDSVKLVCVAATGTNNLDKAFLEDKQIAWRNVAGYSTESVAQHTFAMLFYLYEHLPYYDAYVKSGDYGESPVFTHFDRPFSEISGKTMGIIGLGTIGKRVAEIAKAFGMKVIYYSASGRPPQAGYHQVDFDTLLKTSDIVSIHAPLNSYTRGLMDREAFQKMKKTAILLNTGRGPIVDEKALHDALIEGEIASAGLDVLSTEPIAEDNPLRFIKDERVLITPHVAWATVEARERLLKTICEQIRIFFA